MTRHCKCEEWKNQRAQSSAVLHWNFLFCPWCGVRLIAPCHTCGIPSNEHTSNTLYWYGDKDFCSAACARKLDMKFAKKENK